MSTATKTKLLAKPKGVKMPKLARPDGKPKVKQGTGRHVLFMSDTLFDDDLKR